ncbi:hypothetical protein SAMN05192584_101170 [Streptomyces pini]|uniref:Uncharacterized protein n=1 Tax=Streptomyces pini TaxID=1520580 RepID=A0A1I3TYQ5_9ACTN|nr:hypothetical protein SAMN05192584_101170 [Streptomyces pini]
MPEEPLEQGKGYAEVRGVAGCVETAAAHRDAVGRLHELAERLEEEHGAVTDDEQRAALDRIAAIDGRHDEQRPRSGEVV